MRLKVEIDDLTPEQWDQAQKTLKTSYDIPENASRVCLTLVHGEEERHVETPVSALTSLLWGMSLALAFEALGEAVKTSTRWAPDDDRLPDDRQCGDVLGDGTCLVHDRHISAFPGSRRL
jgi:hypothetical protein